MAVPESLPERIFLLAYDPERGRVRIGTNLGAMLRAAALADLYLGGQLTDERGRAVRTVRHPGPGTGPDPVRDVRHPGHDPLRNALLDEIAGTKPRKWKYWIGRRHRAARGAVRQQLSDRGWVRLQPHKILGLIPTTRVTIRDPRVRKELLGRVNGALKKPIGRTDPADAALVAIVTAGDLNLVFDRRTRRANKRRIQELTTLSGPVGPALRKSIEEASAGGG